MSALTLLRGAQISRRSLIVGPSVPGSILRPSPPSPIITRLFSAALAHTALNRLAHPLCLVSSSFPPSFSTSPSSRLTVHRHRRRFFSVMADDALKRRLDDFQDLFVEARMCIEDAQESQETTYFDEEADAAKEAVDEAVKCFEVRGTEADFRFQK